MPVSHERGRQMARFYGLMQLLILTWALLDPVATDDLQSPNAIIPSSYFGLHFHHLADPVSTPGPNLPGAEWGIWDAEVTWADVEAGRGLWRFEKLDSYVSL